MQIKNALMIINELNYCDWPIRAAHKVMQAFFIFRAVHNGQGQGTREGMITWLGFNDIPWHNIRKDKVANVRWLRNTVSTPDASGATWQKIIEPIITSEAVYTGCGTTRQTPDSKLKLCSISDFKHSRYLTSLYYWQEKLMDLELSPCCPSQGQAERLYS